MLRKLEWDYMTAYSIPHLQKIVDFLKLEMLSVRKMDHGGCIYALQNSRFCKLRHLSFGLSKNENIDGETGPTITDFITSLNPLLSLALTNYARHVNLTPILLHRGPMLRSLSLHEVKGIVDPRLVLYSPQLDDLRIRAPNVESLAIEINRTADESNEAAIYARIVVFPVSHKLPSTTIMGVRLPIQS